MDTSHIEITLAGVKGPAANEQLDKLLSELRRDPHLKQALDTGKTGLKRTDEEAQDFGAVLLAVLGTSAITYLAEALFRYVERTGTSVTANDIEIKNVRSEDIPKIAQALAHSQPPAGRGKGKKSGK